ncbi:MAG: 50S ribosomal protein L29 [Gemmatimonadaceae bacterium]|nr:50S ribosomal protein L29 [Gemmatimonadaceae bacterium]
MLAKDIREMDEAGIRTRIAELEEERFRLRFRAGTETLEDPLRIRVIRRDVARLNTVLKEKIIGIAESGINPDATASKRKKKAAVKTAAKKRGSRRTRTAKRN